MIGQSAGKDYAYLLGVYLGDGSISKRSGWYPIFQVTTIDRDFAEAVGNSLVAVGGTFGINGPYQDKRFSKSRPFYIMYGFGTEPLIQIQQDTKYKLRIPPTIWDASLQERQAFVQGILDSEGYVPEKKGDNLTANQKYHLGVKTTGKWFPDFLRLMEGCGLRLGKAGNHQTKTGKIANRVRIDLTSYCNAGMRFNIRRKQERIEKWAEMRRSTSETLRLAYRYLAA